MRCNLIGYLQNRIRFQMVSNLLGGELNKRCRQFRDLVVAEIGYEQGDFVFSLLLNTSQFEFRLRTILKKILDNRETKWNTAKEETRARLSELSEIYGKGNTDANSSSSRRLVKSDQLEKWFIEREKQVKELNLKGKEDRYFCLLKLLLVFL